MNASDIAQRMRDYIPLRLSRSTTNQCSGDVAGAVRVNRVDLSTEPVIRAQPVARDLSRGGAERDVSLGDPSAELRAAVLPRGTAAGSMLPWLLGGAAAIGAALLLFPRA